MKKKEYSVEDLRKIVRLEDLGSAIWEPADPDQVTCQGTYDMTLDDLQTALAAIIRQKLPLADVRNWYVCLDHSLFEWIGPEDIIGGWYKYVDQVPWYEFPDQELDALAMAWSLLEYLDWDIDRMEEGQTGDQIERVQQAAQYIACFLHNQGLDRDQWVYPDFMKEGFIDDLADDGALAAATQEEQDRFVAWVDELAAKDNKRALHARCYGRYTGNAVYQQDFASARDDAEKLFALTKDPGYANTLGYIYYYGRCTQGQPAYDKALTCFTYGAANGLYESIYKLADMYRNGYGVVQSPETAFRLVAMVYNDLSARFEAQCDGEKYADAALRLGSMLLHGVGVQQNVYAGISTLLAADYAIRRRMQDHDYYGDATVAANIRQCLAEARDMLPPEKNIGRFADPGFLTVSRLLKDDYRIFWNARQLKKGDWSVVFQRIPKRNQDQPGKVFLTIPEQYFCTFTDKVRGHVMPVSGTMPLSGRADFVETDFEDGKPVTVFYYDDEPVLKLEGHIFDWRFPKPQKASGKTVRLVGISFQPEGKVYDYLCDLDDIALGDRVIVDDYDGPTEVLVRAVTDVPEEDLALPLDRYKKIVRKA
jgi:hypothetical protein